MSVIGVNGTPREYAGLSQIDPRWKSAFASFRGQESDFLGKKKTKTPAQVGVDLDNVNASANLWGASFPGS
jgi:hypothetical protein